MPAPNSNSNSSDGSFVVMEITPAVADLPKYNDLY